MGTAGDEQINGAVAGAPALKTAVSSAERLANWAHDLSPTEHDRALAGRSLCDTLAVILAARGDPIRPILAGLPDAARWSTLAHVLSFDDLHMPSTAHISAVCIPAVLACGGGARQYLAAAGVMARLGTALGWSHYTVGWHATCTAGAPAAAAGAALALGLDRSHTAQAIGLAVSAAGGVQRAFGTSAKALQVGFAADAGVRAARLVAAGADADPRALDQWFGLLGGDPAALDLSGPAVPGGLAVKIFPCCYSMQRPISAIRRLTVEDPWTAEIAAIHVTTVESSVRPLVQHRPRNGMQGKLSLEYGVAAAILDGNPGFDSFTDEAVIREAAVDLVERTTVDLEPGGAGLLDGQIRIRLSLADGASRQVCLDVPPGAPSRPPTGDDLRAKLLSCGNDVPELLADVDWSSASELLTQQFSASANARSGRTSTAVGV